MKFLSLAALLAASYCFYKIFDQGINMSEMDFWSYFLALEIFIGIFILTIAYMLIRFGTKKAVRFVKRTK